MDFQFLIIFLELLMDNLKKKIFIVGHFPYPKGLASSHYIFYIRKILKLSKNFVSIYTYSKSFNKLKFKYRFLNLFYSTLTFLIFNINLSLNILYFKIFRSEVVVYYYGRSNLQFKILICLKKIFFSKLIIHISEYEPSFYSKDSKHYKKYYKLYNDFSIHADKLVFISTFVKDYFLNKHAYKYSSIKLSSIFVLPPITDTNKILSTPKLDRKNNYILYSANLTEYINDAIFIIQVFSKLENKSIDLVLIGKINQKVKIKLEKLAESLFISQRVILISEYLSNKVFFSYLRGALALLAPMKKNLRNSSRFPYKLSQYLSSGSLVITSPVGEVKNVLNGKNIVIFSNYDRADFIKTLNINLLNKNNQMSYNSITFSKKYFDYRNYIKPFQNFIDEK